MKKLIIISLCIHIALAAILAPLLVTRLEFDRETESQRSVEVKKRERAWKDESRLQRDRQKLQNETAKVLQQEVELKKRDKLNAQFSELRDKRDGMMQLRKTELQRFQERSEADIRQREILKQTEVIADLRVLLDRDPATTPDVPEDKDDLLAAIEEIEQAISDKMQQSEENNVVGQKELEAAAAAVSAAKESLEKLDSAVDIEAMNHTETAEIHPIQDENFQPEDSWQIYREALKMEKQIAVAKADINAAAEAVSENISYAKARESAIATTPSRPDLALSLTENVPQTVGDLRHFGDNLDRAGNEIRDMNARADAALGRSEQKTLSAASFATSAAMASAAGRTSVYGQVIDMTRFTHNNEGVSIAAAEDEKVIHLDESKIVRAAMPGRRFAESSFRKGWLYLDTWYVIGPWENHSIVDYSVKHPPESEIDFDAKYYDGKFAGRPSHPSEVLKWEFYQSDQVRCQPPAVYAASTYYAYTDVWFEKSRDMLVAVASDDASSVWLNGKLIWKDVGKSDWRIGEGYRKVRFQEGYNDILVRLENGPTHCVWSVVLCPPEILGE